MKLNFTHVQLGAALPLVVLSTKYKVNYKEFSELASGQGESSVEKAAVLIAVFETIKSKLNALPVDKSLVTSMQYGTSSGHFTLVFNMAKNNFTVCRKLVAFVLNILRNVNINNVAANLVVQSGHKLNKTNIQAARHELSKSADTVVDCVIFSKFKLPDNSNEQWDQIVTRLSSKELAEVNVTYSKNESKEECYHHKIANSIDAAVFTSFLKELFGTKVYTHDNGIFIGIDRSIVAKTINKINSDHVDKFSKKSVLAADSKPPNNSNKAIAYRLAMRAFVPASDLVSFAKIEASQIDKLVKSVNDHLQKVQKELSA